MRRNMNKGMLFFLILFILFLICTAQINPVFKHKGVNSAKMWNKNGWRWWSARRWAWIVEIGNCHHMNSFISRLYTKLIGAFVLLRSIFCSDVYRCQWWAKNRYTMERKPIQLSKSNTRIIDWRFSSSIFN